MGTSAASLSERYHAATNYAPETLGRHGGLDLATQPSPFKRWHQARRIALGGGPGSPVLGSPGPLDANRLGRLLHHAYGVTLVREFPGMSMHFRAAPSAGGLYPTELYVATRGIPGVPDGLLDYHAPDHSLVLCWEGDFFPELERFAFGHPAVAASQAVLIATSVHPRSAWRYGDRAWRRVLLDTGHVCAGAEVGAWPDGFQVVPLPAFHDDGIGSLLLLDPTQEGPLLLAPILERGAPGATPQAPGRSGLAVDTPSPDEGGWIPVIQGAGDMDAWADAASLPVPAFAGSALALDDRPMAGSEALLDTVRRRRSTRQFTRETLPAAALGRILSRAWPRADADEPPCPAVPGLLRTHVIVQGVDGVPAGVHRYDPDAHVLHLVREGNPRSALHTCVLRQDLGRDCAFAVVQSLDLRATSQALGERGYRIAHLEAGRRGHRLDLAALQLGYGASGIGGFFDELLASLLQIEAPEAIAYVTTIGVPA